MQAQRVLELPESPSKALLSASVRPATEFRPAEAPVHGCAQGTVPASALSHRAPAYYPRLTRVVQYVAARVGDPLSLAEIAKVACLERKYFSTYFRSKVGMTFTQWLRLVRVKRAMELMRTSDRSIGQVARNAGFRDVRTFERAFKRQAGPLHVDHQRGGGLHGPDHVHREPGS